MRDTNYMVLMSVVLCALDLGCSAAPSEPTPTSNVRLRNVVAETYPGYVHHREKSSFEPASVVDLGLVLPAPVSTRAYTEFGFERIEGPRGIVGLNPNTGYMLASASPAVLAGYKTFGRNADEHHAKVREYFVAAGLPSDQIESVAGGAGFMTLKEVAHPTETVSELVRFHSVMKRSIRGVPIVQSRAFAMLADSGKSVNEGVFWPSLPKAVVDEAAAWRASQTAEAVDSYRAKLPADIEWSQSEGRVVVLHQPDWWYGEPFAMVSYDVQGPAIARHFDREGREFKTPNET